VQRGLVDVWKENLLEDLESVKVEFRSTEKFLLKLKKKFSGGDEKLVKVAELKKVEQEGRTIEEFVQKFRRAARKNGYEGRALVEKFKRRINRVIRRKLMKEERPPTSTK